MDELTVLDSVSPAHASPDGWQRLATAVLLAALSDLFTNRDPLIQLDALCWLGTDDAFVCAELVGVDAPVVRLIRSGGTKKLLKSRIRRGKDRRYGKRCAL